MTAWTRVAPERLVGDGGDERRVGTSAERDDDAVELEQLRLERLQLRVDGDHCVECATGDERIRYGSLRR